jgi:hypothetical protein
MSVEAAVGSRQEGNLDKILKPITRRTGNHCTKI